MDLTTHWTGIASLACFAAGYGLAMVEERLQVRKSVPVLVTAALIWLFTGVAGVQFGKAAEVADAARHTILNFAELMLFLIPAMTYVNTLEDRGLFAGMRIWLTRRGLSFRALFWVTGGLAFAMSPIADNLTTALLLGAVVVGVGRGHQRFIALACINVVVAANAGGAFSPFGDITTLMVWQAGVLGFKQFFTLMVPSLVNWLVPAILLASAIPTPAGRPFVPKDEDQLKLESGAIAVLLLFLATILLTIVTHGALQLPPAVGMMTGLAMLKTYGYLHNRFARTEPEIVEELDNVFADSGLEFEKIVTRPIDIFAALEKVEWDTLMFFYGVLMGIGGLATLGYVAYLSHALFGGLGATVAGIAVGVASAIVDNVPVMFAVLQMSPPMSTGHWLLVTLTTSVGGSLLSIGSAAGVALMGQVRGTYTFGTHLRWSWAVGLGYVASVITHLWLNADLFR